VHNSLYWTGGEWLGLGMAAHSFRRTEGGGERFANLRPVARWFAAVESGSDELALRERLDDAALAREAVWLGLRLLEDGVNRARFAERFDADPVAHFASAFARLEAAGLVTIDPARARLTRRGALLADEVAARFL
jgi:oxygen-independent coproporphyrinogen-3 oxidase